MDDEPQVGQNQALGGVEVVAVAEAGREVAFLLHGQDGYRIGGVDVLIETAEPSGEHELRLAGR
jgi:hypothetical protein